jgi:chromosome segregation ATPase
MKPRTFATGRSLLLILTVALTVGLVSWDHRQSPGKNQQTFSDTTPKKKSTDKKVRDLDDVFEELERADWQVDFEKAQVELAEAMKKIDGEKIKLDIEKAMKNLDMTKLQKELDESMARIDFEKIKKEMSEAMKSVDLSKLQKELEESLSKIDFEKAKVEMEKLKEVDMKKLDEDMKKLSIEMKELGPKLEVELSKAKEELEKAKAELKEFKGFVDGLESDGLINKKEGYTLKHKDGELFINGKKASDATYNKYRSFLEKHKKFSIEKDDDDFDIDMD